MDPTIEAPYKRLVICCDGTWQDALKDVDGKGDTNVAKFSRAVEPFGVDADGRKISQVVLYQSGLGSEKGLDSLSEGAFGTFLSVKVAEVYGFLCQNFCPRDEVSDSIFSSNPH